jgi:hypothetical protein
MYIHISRSPGMTEQDYEKVIAELGPEPITGKLQHYVGEDNGALVVVDVWQSRADADRFAAERLFPAFERMGTHPSPSTNITAFEATAR